MRVRYLQAPRAPVFITAVGLLISTVDHGLRSFRVFDCTIDEWLMVIALKIADTHDGALWPCIGLSFDERPEFLLSIFFFFLLFDCSFFLAFSLPPCLAMETFVW